MAALSRHKGGGLGLVHLQGPGALIFHLLRKSWINSPAAPKPLKSKPQIDSETPDILFWQLLGSYQA